MDPQVRNHEREVKLRILLVTYRKDPDKNCTEIFSTERKKANLKSQEYTRSHLSFYDQKSIFGVHDPQGIKCLVVFRGR